MTARCAQLKILIADDHAGMRRILRRACVGLATEIIECDSGEAAVEAFSRHAPDWVILDVQMPGLGGLKATEAIRKLNAAARIIVVSQFAEPDYDTVARRAGALHFLNKTEVYRLAEVIQANLPGTGTANNPPASPL